MWDLQINMEPEDGCLWVHGVGEDGVPAFTAYRIECSSKSSQTKEPCGLHRRLTILAGSVSLVLLSPNGNCRLFSL